MSRATFAGLVVTLMCAAPVAIRPMLAAETAAPSVAEQVFFERLRALVESRRWAEAARHVQQAEALRPAVMWLSARDGEVRLAQVRIGLGQRDLPAAAKAARLFANGDEPRAQQLLAVAREAHATGDLSAAVALAREIVRRSPDFSPAVRALGEWEPVAEKKLAPAKKLPAGERDETATLLTQIRSAREADNLPAMVTAARLFLTGDHARATRLLELAREFFSSGDRAAALLLTREVVRRTPDFPAAERQLEEFRAAEKK